MLPETKQANLNQLHVIKFTDKETGKKMLYKSFVNKKGVECLFFMVADGFTINNGFVNEGMKAKVIVPITLKEYIIEGRTPAFFIGKDGKVTHYVIRKQSVTPFYQNQEPKKTYNKEGKLEVDLLNGKPFFEITDLAPIDVPFDSFLLKK